MTPDNNKPINTGIRLASMVLDHLFMTFIAVVFMLPMMITGIIGSMNDSHGQTGSGFMLGPGLYIFLFGFSLYFCKDVINGRSIAKRILKLQVVDNKTGQVASPIQCFVRNLFCIIWPVEVIMALIDPARRLGDKVAGTRLAHYDALATQQRSGFWKYLLPLIISYGFLVCIVQLMPSVKSTSRDYSEASYNPRESKELERLISDSLGAYMLPDVRVYDSVKNAPIKYFSVILHLKENYIDDNDRYHALHEKTTSVIYSKFPRESFTGRIRYVYRSSGQFQSSETTFGEDLPLKNTR